MRKEVRFFVPGDPAPGGSKSGFAIKKGGVYTGRVAIVDAGGKRTKEWRQQVATTAMQSMKAHDLAPFEGPVEMELLFKIRRPKSHYRADGISLRPQTLLQHVQKPDVLKFARSTEDALTGKVWRDDCQVVKETLEKAWTDQQSGCWVVVREAE